jgi:hypothetical protein
MSLAAASHSSRMNQGINWQGPLTWSRDGLLLALVGQRSDSDANWVYLVPLDGSGPRSIGLTHGASGALQFSPSLPVLAYGTSDPPGGGLMAYRTDLSAFIPLTHEDNHNRGLVTGYPGSFEWSPDGYQIAYLAEGSQQVHLKVTQALSPFSAPPYDNSINNLLLHRQAGEGALRDVSWVPGEDGRVLVFLQDEAGTGCWTVHVRSARDPNLEPMELPGLCVEGSISRASWSPDSQWLVILARQPQEETPALYALRIPRSQSASTAPIFERLVDMPFESGSNLAALPKPQVRPAGNGLSINPQSVKVFEPILPPSMPTRDIPGQILYHVYDTPVRGFYSIHPGDDAGKILSDRGENRTCPAISPSGEQVAFLSEANSAHRGINEVYVMDFDGSNTVQLTNPVFSL